MMKNKIPGIFIYDDNTIVTNKIVGGNDEYVFIETTYSNKKNRRKL